MSIKNNTYFNTFGSVTSDGKILPNNNVLYGPYESVDAAYTEISNQLGDAIPIGLTVGIVTNNTIKEYWFSGGINKSNLVVKVKDSYTKTESDDKYALKTNALKSITPYYTYKEDSVESASQGLTDNNSEVNLPSSVIRAATKTTAGVMSAADKDKLDGLTGAYVQIVTSEQYITMEAEGTLDENTVYYIKG